MSGSEQRVSVELGSEFDEFFQPAPRAKLAGTSGGTKDVASMIQKMNPTAAAMLVPPAPLLNNQERVKQSSRYKCVYETPRQRLVLELAAKGLTQKEIAEHTGYTPLSVHYILHQPHVQQTLVDEVRRTADLVDQQVLEIVKEGCLKAAQRLLRIVEDDKAPAMAHISAAEKFLERRYGKANQPINSGTNIDLNTLTDGDLAKMLTPTDGTGTNGT